VPCSDKHPPLAVKGAARAMTGSVTRYRWVQWAPQHKEQRVEDTLAEMRRWLCIFGSDVNFKTILTMVGEEKSKTNRTKTPCITAKVMQAIQPRNVAMFTCGSIGWDLHFLENDKIQTVSFDLCSRGDLTFTE
jgi:hypothetical protein